MKRNLTVLCLLVSIASFAQTGPRFVVGTYTSGGSDGIYVFRFDTINGSAVKLSAAKISNPSYITISPNHKFVYAVREEADTNIHPSGGYVAAFSFSNKNNTLQQINQQPSGGNHPCFITLDKTSNWLFVANYSGGNFSSYTIKKNGGVGKIEQTIQHTGHSVNLSRQQAPHVHQTVVTPDNRYLLVNDLGLDKIMIYALDLKRGRINAANPPFQLTDTGAGPRHLEFHPNGKYVYLVEELSGGVSVFYYADGKLKLLQHASALTSDFKGQIGSADIHVSTDGRFLYVSNRGTSNDIAIFSINANDGMIKLITNQSSLGKGPRNFNFDPTGNFLLVANQNSDEIVVFRRNKETGILSDTGQRIAVSKPVCIKWLD